MAAYSQLQQKELACEALGYEAAKHQQFVGTGYFDLVTQVVAGGLASTTALEGSTEVEQFFSPVVEGPSEEMLTPSGD